MNLTSSNNSHNGLRQKLHSAFCSHPAAVGESYFEHQRAAFGFAVKLAIAAGAALVHSLVPALCEHTARNRIAALHQQLQARSPEKPEKP